MEISLLVGARLCILILPNSQIGRSLGFKCTGVVYQEYLITPIGGKLLLFSYRTF